MAEKADGGERFLFVVKSRDARAGGPTSRAAKMAEGDEVRLLALASPDFRPLLPHACEPGDPSTSSTSDIPSRTARITIDARLQTQVSGILERGGRSTARRRRRSSLDADTGQVLAQRNGRTSIPATRSSCGA